MSEPSSKPVLSAGERLKPIVAIDGPAGAGKSTVARLLAQQLGYVYIDTGAMYRAVALAAARRGVSWDEGESLGVLASRLLIEFVPTNERTCLLLDGEDVSQLIRTREMSDGSSRVSAWPGVRRAMVQEQRRIGDRGGVVMEGRDIGTVVFPGARAKIYLTATVEERVRRRAEELEARGEAVDRARLRDEVMERDRRDIEREHSPLRRAADAVEVITDGMTAAEVVETLARLVHEREAG